MINIYKPYLTTDSLKYAHDALNSTWISSQGKYLKIIIEKLKNLLKISYIIPLNNGTSACHLVSKTLHRCFPPSSGNKRIIVPNNVYVAAWNAFLFDSNYELIPIDADLNTWNISISELERSINKYPDAAVLIVHNIGNIINIPNLKNKFPNTQFVEDNCEGFLGKYEGQYSGSASFSSSISFFANKNITSGEGGAFLTNCKEAFEYGQCIQGQGQSSSKFIHNELGYNYRMTNIQAALLCGQIECMQEITELKNEIFHYYTKAFENREDIKIQISEKNTIHSNWMFGIRIVGQPSYLHAEKYFMSKNIETRPMFYSIYSHNHLKNNSKIISNCDCKVADLLNKECLILPSYPQLSKDEQDYIIKSVNDYVEVI